jgi:hypothetical protein
MKKFINTTNTKIKKEKAVTEIPASHNKILQVIDIE